MKKVIKGKLYDTEKAKRLGEYEPNPYRRDFNWFCETLYQKRTGEFFLRGDGNAASKYSRSCGQNEWCGDEKIIPLSFAEAQKWVEEHLNGDEYVEIFGDPEEADKKQVISVSVTDATYRKLKEIAAETGKPMGEIIDNLIK